MRGGHYMSADVELIRKSQLVTSKWSGGTTTELLIFPPNAEYAKRNFKWRLSSAKVEDEESVFTNLPGISRIIMILKGKLLLQHEGHYSVELKHFEQDCFSGAWTTKSFGRVTDFNLMMAEGCSGNVEAIKIGTAKDLDLLLEGLKVNGDFTDIAEVLYCAEGQAEICIDADKNLKLFEEDLVYIKTPINEKGTKVKLYNIGDRELKIIRATVYTAK